MVFSSVRRPTSIEEALRPLSSASEDDVSVLVSAISGPHSFALSKPEIERLSSNTALSQSDLTYLLAYLSALYDHVQELVGSGTPYPDAIEGVVEDLDSALTDGDKETLRGRLSELLRTRPTHEHSEKVRRLRTGFLPNAVGFSSLVDLRPNFNGDEDDIEISGYVLTTQFRVTTDAVSALHRRLVFQVSEEGLAEMRKAIDRAENKLRALKAQTSFSSMLIEE